MTPIETAEKFYLLKNKVDEGDAKPIIFYFYYILMIRPVLKKV